MGLAYPWFVKRKMGDTPAVAVWPIWILIWGAFVLGVKSNKKLSYWKLRWKHRKHPAYDELGRDCTCNHPRSDHYDVNEDGKFPCKMVSRCGCSCYQPKPPAVEPAPKEPLNKTSEYR